MLCPTGRLCILSIITGMYINYLQQVAAVLVCVACDYGQTVVLLALLLVLFPEVCLEALEVCLDS